MEDTSASCIEHKFETISKNQSVWYVEAIPIEEIEILDLMKKMGYEINNDPYSNKNCKIELYT